MLIGHYSKSIGLKSVFLLDNKPWVILDIETHPKAPGWSMFHMAPVIDWEIRKELKKVFDKQYFLDGSGFGGGPAFVEDVFYKHNGDAVYRLLELE